MTASPARLVCALAVVACGGAPAEPVGRPAPAPVTPSDRMLAMLPPGVQVVVELDLARLRANPVVGRVVARALAEPAGELPAGVPRPSLALADRVVLAAYGVGTAQAATLTVLAAPTELAGATRVADGYYAIGPADWIDQVLQRVALAGTGEAAFAIRAAPELLALRDHALPAEAPGAALRITARLPFDARVALSREVGLDGAPAQLSAWADVADDLALIVDCDAADPGNRPGKAGGDAATRLAGTLRRALAALAELPTVRALGLPSSLAGTKLITRGTWVRAIVAIGPAHLRRVVERAAALLPHAGEPPP